MNKAIIIGNIGQAPELRYTPNNLAVTKLRVATNEKYKDKERTEWHSVVVFGNQAKHCAEYLTKGNKVAVEGRISSRKFTNKQGQEQTVVEILADHVMFLTGWEENKKVSTTTSPDVFLNNMVPNVKLAEPSINDEDIPF